jgi:hypothetical protein
MSDRVVSGATTARRMMMSALLVLACAACGPTPEPPPLVPPPVPNNSDPEVDGGTGEVPAVRRRVRDPVLATTSVDAGGKATGLPPRLASFGGEWPSCPFPKEADAKRIEEGFAVIRVYVASDGHPEQVELQNDSGYGFGEAASSCAMKQTYVAAVDGSGQSSAGWTRRFLVRFRH